MINFISKHYHTLKQKKKKLAEMKKLTSTYIWSISCGRFFRESLFVLLSLTWTPTPSRKVYFSATPIAWLSIWLSHSDGDILNYPGSVGLHFVLY